MKKPIKIQEISMMVTSKLMIKGTFDFR